MTVLLLRLLEAILGRLSLRTVQRLGAVLGLMVHRLLPIRRSEVRRALGERLGLGAAEARATARAMYRHLGVSALEFLWMGRQGPTALAGIVRRVGWDNYRSARAGGRGVVVVTGHVGNWDLCACSQAALGEPLHVVTKRLTARGLDAYWMKRRRAMGVVLHEPKGSMRALLEALRAGAAVGMVIDQRDEHGIMSPFLGRDAATSVAAATLALRTGAPLVPTFMVRDPDGGHTLHIGAAIELERDLAPRLAIERATHRCNDALSAIVRAHPAQWLWLHRRWNSRSAGRSNGPRRIALPARARYTEI